MFQRLYFAYKLSKYMVTQKFTYDDIDTSNFDLNFEEFLIDVDPIIADLAIIHTANANESVLSTGTKNQIFENLVYWEHMAIIQPELELIFGSLHSVLKYTLQNVPGRNIEKYLLEPLFDLRTTYNLSCFKDQDTFLKTNNFLDANDRVDQAMLFYDQVKDSIKKMSIIECFKDPYYIHSFPESFYQNTETYLKEYRLTVLGSDSISKVH